MFHKEENESLERKLMRLVRDERRLRKAMKDAGFTFREGEEKESERKNREIEEFLRERGFEID